MPDWILQLIITSLVIPAFIWVGLMIRKLVEAKVDAMIASSNIQKKEELRVAFSDALNKLSDAVFTSVMETQRTFVAAIEKEGELTEEQKKEAFQLSHDRVKEIMSNVSLELIQDVTGSLEQLIKTQIEAQLPQVKAIIAQTTILECPEIIKEEQCNDENISIPI